jgi:hypothetical protein
MATRRRRVKHSHNKTRTTSKALLRKTTYNNKKNKQNKTKKRYQSGGGPTASTASKKRAKGDKGVPTEEKYFRYLVRSGQVNANAYEKQKIYQKKDNTAEFDLHMNTTGLPYHISVKSVKRKTPGQKSFSIMCGKSNRFITQAGIGNVPYHMVIVIREKHPTDPNKTQYRALDIDLRGDEGKRLLFGIASDCQIKDIVKEAEYLSNAYCKNDGDLQNNNKIADFNKYLKDLGAKIQLAPKKGNPDSKRSTRAQSSITGFNPNSPTSMGAVVEETILSSEPNSANSANSNEGINGGPVELAASRNSRATSGRRAPGSRGTSSRKTSSIHGISKQPTPQVSYFRSFKPRDRGTTQLQVIPAESPPTLSALQEKIDE